jgi:hypothetical protein
MTFKIRGFSNRDGAFTFIDFTFNNREDASRAAMLWEVPYTVTYSE